MKVLAIPTLLLGSTLFLMTNQEPNLLPSNGYSYLPPQLSTCNPTTVTVTETLSCGSPTPTPSTPVTRRKTTPVSSSPGTTPTSSSPGTTPTSSSPRTTPSSPASRSAGTTPSSTPTRTTPAGSSADSTPSTPTSKKETTPSMAMMLMPYNFAYGVKDDEGREMFRHEEISDGNDVRGEYSVVLPDGRMQVVKFTAAPGTGYVPKISYVHL